MRIGFIATRLIALAMVVGWSSWCAAQITPAPQPVTPPQPSSPPTSVAPPASRPVTTAPALPAPPTKPAFWLPVAPPAFSEPIDPLTVDDEDFARHRDPSEWAGLSVRRLTFNDGTLTWTVWRIVNDQHGDGPLWVLPHDNENATFGAALMALHKYGGIAMAIDDRANRMNYDSTSGASVDPNRHFYDAIPLYAGRILADVGTPPRLIVALHTNSPGFDQSLSLCPISGLTGSGDISIKLCTARYIPRPSLKKIWPFDDDDSLALVPYPAGSDWRAAFCVRPLMKADFNLITEQVSSSDGSLSNYALAHGLTYINFETRERGSDPVGLADAQARLVAMIDRALALCTSSKGPTPPTPVMDSATAPAPAPLKP